MLAVAVTGTLLQHTGAPGAARPIEQVPHAARIWRQYLPLVLVNVGLALYVARLFRPRNVLPELLGRRFHTAADALADLLYASFAFVLICVLDALGRPLFAGRNAAFSALLPSTEAERLTWLLVASVVGFCEEVVYRGYLQTQLGALTRRPALGVFLQAVLFGLGHLEQGPGAALRIGVYGLIFGLLARQRESLLPGIVCHVGLDALSAFVR
ncbi:MAG TPA: type II CAAX endopeptidase family protein [Polyangiaceae bacterium]|nr:type II CAAX endopeptidase family protein [Polyangiaceae bacterium]